jgi:predicted glycosyltransferase
MELPAELQEKTVCVGEIYRRESPRSPVSGKHAPHELVITGGGGGHRTAVEFFNLALRAVPTLRGLYPELSVLLVTGPLFSKWMDLDLTSNVRIVPFLPDMLEVLSSARIVISQAGYNTANDLIRAGVPAILVPGDRIFDDQFERADTLVKSYPNFRTVRGDDAEDLSRVAADLLRSGVRVTNTPPLSGGCEAAYLVASAVSGRLASHGI